MRIVDEIIESLRQEIVTRRLPDGERLPSEKELSVKYGVSQPTIREAIRGLETIGLIQVLHGKGTFVRGQADYAIASALQTLLQLESVSILEVLSVRQVLGRRSIELAASNATEADMKKIEAACERFNDLSDLKEAEQVIAYIIDFQQAVSSAAHSPLLQSLELFMMALLNEVQVTSLTNHSVKFWRDRAMAFQGHRIAIVDGLRSKDPKVALKAMDKYFDAQRERFEKDKNLSKLNLASQDTINIVSDMVRHLKD